MKLLLSFLKGLKHPVELSMFDFVLTLETNEIAL